MSEKSDRVARGAAAACVGGLLLIVGMTVLDGREDLQRVALVLGVGLALCGAVLARRGGGRGPTSG